MLNKELSDMELSGYGWKFCYVGNQSRRFV
jgi:hypothetical protein